MAAQDIPPAPDEIQKPAATTAAPQNVPPPPADNTPLAPPVAPPAPDDSSNVSIDGPLPDIEAKTYPLKAIKMSTSKKVYLLEITGPPSTPPAPDASGTSDSQVPAARKILLLRVSGQNIMALRVFRAINGTQQIIAKRIRAYDGNVQLSLTQEYTAIEKISDIVPPPPTEQDKADISEVLPAPLPFDPDLDAGSSPDPNNIPTPSGTDENPEEPPLGAAVEEHNTPFEKYDNWLMVGVAAMPSKPDYYFLGTGVRYSRDLIDRLFTFEDNRIDTLSVDMGFYYIQIVGLGSFGAFTGGSYGVLPLMLTGRYTYYFNENFGLFGYLGFNKGFVMSSSNSSQDELNNLQSVSPAGGLGGIIRFGPQWYFRFDAGIDMIGLSLMLRF